MARVRNVTVRSRSSRLNVQSGAQGHIERHGLHGYQCVQVVPIIRFKEDDFIAWVQQRKAHRIKRAGGTGIHNHFRLRVALNPVDCRIFSAMAWRMGASPSARV